MIFILENRPTSFGSDRDRLLGIVARSESVVAEEAALDIDNFRLRAFGCRGR